MKRQLIKLFSISLIATSGFASAMNYDQSNCNPCENYNPCGEYAIWGDGLYFAPSSCSTNYVLLAEATITDDTQTVNGKEQGTCPDYGWGFRVGGSYFFPCSEFDAVVYYSGLNNSSCQTTTASDSQFLAPTMGPASLINEFLANGVDLPAKATSQLRHKWDAVDGEVGYTLKKGCNFSMRGHVGLHWTKLRVEKEAGYTGVFFENPDIQFEGTSKDTIKTWGLGPRFGGDLNYDIGCGIGLVARASWGVLVGQTKANYFVSSTETETSDSNTRTFNICSKERCVVFPEFDTSLGLNYNLCLNGCWDFSFELGWEFRSYLQSIVHGYLPGDGTTTVGVCDPFNLEGLYLRGVIKF